MFSGFLIAAVFSRFGTIGVFVIIAGSMGLVAFDIAVFGPLTRGRRLEDLSP